MVMNHMGGFIVNRVVMCIMNKKNLIEKVKIDLAFLKSEDKD
jgi:hypothetical protein